MPRIKKIKEFVYYIQDFIFTKDRGKYSYVLMKKSLNKTYQNNRRDIGKEISISTLNNYIRNIKVFLIGVKIIIL